MANRANHDNGLCCPSLSRIVEETELSESTVLRSLTQLEEAGLIVRERRRRENGSHTSTSYRFPHVATPFPHGGGTPSPTVTPPEPELRTGSRTKPLMAAAPPNETNGSHRPRNETWDALAAIFGEPTTRGAQKVRGKVCSSLRAAAASPDEIISRAKRWPLHFDGATMTDLALEKHWDTLARQPLRRSR